MQHTDVETGRRATGRVVMLVDNNVDDDSRVQKAARSAAERGWDVVLLGRASTQPRTWMIGNAEVRLLPMTPTLGKRRHEFRRRWLIAPLAYPPTGVAARRAADIKAWRADLALRRKSVAVLGQHLSRPDRAVLRAEATAAKVTGKWISLRTRQLKFGQRMRNHLTLPTDRLYTAFWQKLYGNRAWRRLEPGLWDYEFAYGKAIDGLAPDLIHANDFRMLGVGARAITRARAAGRDVKLVWDAHEFLPGVQSWQNNRRWLPANLAHEREYAPYADAVITVSETLAELLQQTHKLPRRPDVVLNAPDIDHAVTAEPPAESRAG